MAGRYASHDRAVKYRGLNQLTHPGRESALPVVPAGPGDERLRSRCRRLAEDLKAGPKTLTQLMRDGWSDGYVLGLIAQGGAWFSMTGQGRWREASLSDEGRRELIGGGS